MLKEHTVKQGVCYYLYMGIDRPYGLPPPISKDDVLSRASILANAIISHENVNALELGICRRLQLSRKKIHALTPIIQCLEDLLASLREGSTEEAKNIRTTIQNKLSQLLSRGVAE
jgi:hypothetical protein